VPDNSSHIIFICSRLDLPGGTERAIINTANLLASRQHLVTLLVIHEHGSSFFPVDPRVQVVTADLHFGNTRKGNPLLRKLWLRRDVQKLEKAILALHPSMVIGTDYVMSIAAQLAVGKRLPVFAWEHHHYNWLQKSAFWRLLQRRIYPKLAAVIALNNTEAGLYKKAGCNTIVIPNFVDKGERTSLSQKLLLTVGWLNKRKGVDLIPDVARIIFAKHPDWRWKIIGEGEEGNHLREAIKKLNLGANVFIHSPSQPDLSETYLSASVYAMTSRFECFPMVLLEAMSHGIPAVAFDCPTGPADIIRNGIDGILTDPENVEELATALIGLMEDDKRLRQLGANAHEGIVRFSPGLIYEKWLRLIEQYQG